MTNKEGLFSRYNSVIEEGQEIKKIDILIHFSKWGDNTISNVTKEQLDSIRDRYNDNLERNDCTDVYIKEVTMHTENIAHSIIFNRREKIQQLS